MNNRGGRGPGDKGRRDERRIVRLLRGLGFRAERIPLSGAAGGSFAGDIVLHLQGGVKLTAEVKCRADGFKQIYKWLSGRDLLVIRADRADPLIVMPLNLATQFWEPRQ